MSSDSDLRCLISFPHGRPEEESYMRWPRTVQITRKRLQGDKAYAYATKDYSLAMGNPIMSDDNLSHHTTLPDSMVMPELRLHYSMNVQMIG